MSDKGLLFKKRKNNHGSHHKCSKGSGFPRHSMNHYPGTHLGMKLRYSKPSVGCLYCEWGPNRGYLRTNRITGFINKFIGKPYNDLVKAFYALIKDLRDSHKEVGLSDLEWHFEQFRYRRWRGDYYVDDDGLVHPESVRKQTSHINKQQVAYNKKVKIPDFGRVSLPRTPSRETNNRYCLPEYGSVSYEKPQYDAPRFLGNYWCDMDGKTERCQKELDEALEKLRKTPNMAYFEVGYGQLYPMVKRYDYEKALRIYEQEQKETSMEGQE